MKNIFLILSLFFSIDIIAQHNHGGGEHDENEEQSLKYAPQHGGEIIEAGKYKLEVLVNPMQKEEKLCVYVLKKNSHKQVELKNASGIVEIKYKDGTTEHLNLTATLEKLYGEPQNIGSAANYCFIIVINKKEYRACYFYTGIIKN